MNQYVLAVVFSVGSLFSLNASDVAQASYTREDFKRELRKNLGLDKKRELNVAPEAKSTFDVSVDVKNENVAPGSISRLEAVKAYVKDNKVAVATGMVVTVAAVYGVYKFVAYVKAKRAERALILAELEQV